MSDGWEQPAVGPEHPSAQLSSADGRVSIRHRSHDRGRRAGRPAGHGELCVAWRASLRAS